MKKENRSHNIEAKHVKLDKHQCYELAKSFWEKGDAQNAEKWALNAMRIGSKNLAPQLLADIARSTRSKSTAITLASYYWSQKDTEKALYWANVSKNYGSANLADTLISEIQAHLDAAELHREMEYSSKSN